MATDYLSARQVLATNLRYLRKCKGLSQEALAERSGLHRTYIGSIERCERNVSIDNIERLAIALECDIPELLTRKSSDATPSGQIPS